MIDVSSKNTTPRLQCTALSGEDADKNEILSGVPLQQETGKKSSFLFHPKEPLRIPKPSHLVIDYSASTSSSPKGSGQVYFLGGFQIVSNARHSEVYLTDKNGKEEYLTTSKGIPFEKGTSEMEWYKAVCVVPGGPRPILGLRIKLLSLKPANETTAHVKTFKLTARVPETPTTVPTSEQASTRTTTEPNNNMNGGSSSTSMAASANSSTTTTPQAAGITQADLGAVMASLSIMARTTESGIENAMSEKYSGLEKLFQNRMATLEQHITSLTTVAASQRISLEEQTKLLVMQQTMMEAQSDQIKTLLEQQTAMVQIVRDLQAELSSLRQEVKHDKEKKAQPKKMPRIATRPPPSDEEPIEGGIEQTLSNLDQGEEDDEDEDGDIFSAAAEPSIPLAGTASTHRLSKPIKGKIPDPLVEGEKIEVSLLDGGTKSMHVHEEKVEGVNTVDDPSQGDITSPLDHVPKIAQSFDDRNDKNDVKEAEVDTPDKVELEVMAGHDDEIVAVLESTTADQHERSPAPDVCSEANLLDL